MTTQDKIKMDVNWGIKKMDKRYGILIVSVTILVLCFVGTASATNWSVDGSGGADFSGIQEAINNATDGDTIIVHSGVYYENVVVDKLVTLKGINLPVVDADGEGSAITLTADGITLVGFTATNSTGAASASTIPATITPSQATMSATTGSESTSTFPATITPSQATVPATTARPASASTIPATTPSQATMSATAGTESTSPIPATTTPSQATVPATTTWPASASTIPATTSLQAIP
jgi:hypothetical protein